MAMLAFQAVHSPLQAPEPYIQRYLKRYEAGWSRIRAERQERQGRMGIAPPGLELPLAKNAKAWDTLSADEKRFQAKKMAVFAGMLNAADEQVGRLREHLRKAGILDNTVFIVMSDNGADAYDLSQLNLPFKVWYRVNNKLGYDTLGAKGSYVHYGQDWAEVSNTPLRQFKGTSGEGGMRVPFIMQVPGRLKPGTVTNEFAYATDFLPTVLDIAGIGVPTKSPPGTSMIAPTGKSLLPYLEGRAPGIHGPDEAIGFEGTGGEAIFRGGYKLMRNGEPFDDHTWHLYETSDWTESRDLSKDEPQRVEQMLSDMQRYIQQNGVVTPEPGYQPLKQLLKNNAAILLRQLGGILAAVVLVLLGVPLALFVWWRHGRRRRRLALAMT
jgi:arylsulfatase/uncharacterized sulfatase